MLPSPPDDLTGDSSRSTAWLTAGESAGGNLAIVTLVDIRDAGLPLPFAGLLMSSWADVAGTGESSITKAEIDLALTASALRIRAHVPLGVIPSYTFGMKTAISLPDATFDRASRRARELGMSRSEFFARAALSYLDELDVKALTGQINAAVEAIDGVDESTAFALRAGERVISDGSEGW